MPLITKKILLLTLLVIPLSLKADVKSLGGTIQFDSNSDSNAEMTLNTTGLGIGVTPSTNLEVSGNAIITEQLFLGSSTGSSNFNLHGTLGFGVETVSSNSTLGGNSLVLVNTSSDNIDLTLPNPSLVPGRTFTIKKIQSENRVTIHCLSGNTIDHSHSMVLPSSSLGAVELISDGGSGWNILSQYSSNTLWNPAQIQTSVWFDASDTSSISLSNGNVTQWNDKSGENNHAGETTDAKMPVSGTRTINSLNVIDFDGTDDRMTFDNVTCHEKSVFMVLQPDTSTSTMMFMGGNALNNQLRLLAANNFNYTSATLAYPQTFSTNTISDAQTGLVNFEFDTNSLAIYLNGNFESEQSPYVSANVSGVQFGQISARGAVANGSNFFDGLQAEIIITESVPDSSTRQKIEGYLAHKWGIESSLDASHPYKSTPPYSD